MKNIVEFWQKMKFSHKKGLYLLSHTKSVGAVDIFRYSLLGALK
jgi:hypothetical protein